MITLYFLVVAMFLLWINYLWTRRNWYIASWKMRGPFSLPIAGSLALSSGPNGIFRTLNRLRHKYRSNFRIWATTRLIIYIYNPNDLQKILNSPNCIDKSFGYEYIKDFIGDGLIVSNGKRWIQHRKLINPSFSHKVLLSFFPIFNRYTDQLIQELGKFEGTGYVHLLHTMTIYNLRITGDTILGFRLEEEGSHVEELIDAFENAKEISGMRIFSLWQHWDVLFRLTKYYDIQKKSKRIFDSLFEKILKKKSLASKKDPTRTAVTEEDRSKIYIDRAINLINSNIFTVTDAINEATNLSGASLDSTSITITHIIQCLAIYPECQRKVIEEIWSLFPQEHFEVSYEDTKNMVYCDLVINETLRLMPSVPVISRTVSEDFQLHDGNVIPKGAIIYIDILNAHRDPDYWGPNALDFDPNRFIDSDNVNQFVYMPFSRGIRNCIGWRNGTYSLKVYMAKIFKNYYFTTNQKLQDYHFRMDISLTSIVTPVVKVHKLE